MIDEELIRKEYAFLSNCDKVLVNICMLGIPPLRTQRASEHFAAGYTEYTMGVDPDRYSVVRGHTRALLAKLIGGSPDEIALTKNTTEGVSILANGYPLGPGDNVVTCDLENHSNLFPWFANAQTRGYEVRVVKTARGRITPEELEALMDEHTKIVSVSAVQAQSGYFADLRAIGEMAHRHGAILAVDAIQALGRVCIDVREMNIDYLSCGGFKGLLSMLGIGFLWCRADLINSIRPPYVGFTSAGPYYAPPLVTPNMDGFHLLDGNSRLEAGTINMHGVAMMESSVGLMHELGPKEIEQKILSLDRALRARLADTRFDVLTPESDARLSGLIVMYYPPELGEQVGARLAAHRIDLTHHDGYIRLAFGMHNTMSDVERLADVFDEISDEILA